MRSNVAAPTGRYFQSRRCAAAPLGSRRTRVQLAVAPAAKSADTYAEIILDAEARKDWLAAFEALTEARVSHIQLQAPAVESAVRTLAQGGQWQQAADLLERLIAAGSVPSVQTLTFAFRALATGKQHERAVAVLEAVKSLDGATPGVVSVAHNGAVRCMARSGQAVAAYALLDAMVCSRGAIAVELETYTCVCNELIKVGEGEKAEEVLEWRDFLNGD